MKSIEERLVALEKRIGTGQSVFEAWPGLGRVVGDLLVTGRISSTSNDGWIKDTRTWTYASATSFTRTGASTLWGAGKGIYYKYKQGGAYKYGVGIGTSGDTQNLTGGSDYSLANAPITDTYYSLMCPADFPGSFAFTPAFVSAGATFAYTSRSGRFSIHGQRLRVWAYLLLNGAPGGTLTNPLYIRLPVASVNIALAYNILPAFPEKIAFGAGYTGFHLFLNPNTTDANLCVYGTGQALYPLAASALASGASMTVSGEYLI